MQPSSTVLSLQSYHQAHAHGQLSRSSSISGGGGGGGAGGGNGHPTTLQLAILDGTAVADEHHHAHAGHLQLEIGGNRRPSAMLHDLLSTRRPSTLLAAIRGPQDRHHHAQHYSQQQQLQQQQCLGQQRPRLLSSLHELTGSDKSLEPAHSTDLQLLNDTSAGGTINPRQSQHNRHRRDTHASSHALNDRHPAHLPGNGGANGANGGGGGRYGERAQRQRQQNRRIGDDALSAALSLLYAKIVVILGIAMPVTEVLTHRVPATVYQSFYIYLYVTSVAFVLFLHVTQMRTRAIVSLIKTYHENRGEYPIKRRTEHFGSFYLRVGAISFGIGTMVYSGLELGQYFEMSKIPDCSSILSAITPAARMALSIVQMQFIFLNTTELDMAKHKVIARFGLMHMVATNLCEWLYVLVEETKHEIHAFTHHANASAYGALLMPPPAAPTTVAELLLQQLGNGTAVESTTTAAVVALDTARSPAAASYFSGHLECARTNMIMGNLVQNASPFLFPCTIEYSLICAVILYEMWKKVKSLPDIERSRRNSNSKHPAAGGTPLKRAHHFSVDCARAHRGMFAGILVIVITIICLIMYFVLHEVPTYEQLAIAEVTVCEIILYAVTTLAVLAAVVRMRDLRYQRQQQGKHSSSVRLDCTLLVLAQTGVYLYGMFSIMGSYYAMEESAGGREALAAEILGLVQTSVQTLFILNACWRRCRGQEQNRTKPGREIVTFLLVANMSMWFICTMIKSRAGFRPSHLALYGEWAWTVITHVSMPLAIFYRFHSTICLFEIWKSAYKVKGGEH